MRLFLDANVVLDVLTRREPWYDHSAAVMSLLEEAGFEGFVAAHAVTTVHYLSRKHIDQEKAAAAIVNLLKLVRAEAVDQDVLLKASGFGWSDAEDAVHAVCAINCGADYLVARNTQDFRGLSIPVVTPTELLALLADDETGPQV